MHSHNEAYVYESYSRPRISPIQEVEVIDSPDIPDFEQQQFLGSAAELLDALVQRFEQTIMCKEQELLELRATVDDSQAAADAYRQELETVSQVCAILERENRRLSAEVEKLRHDLHRASSPERMLEDLLLNREIGR